MSGWIEYLCLVRCLAAFEAARARVSKGWQRVESDGGGFFKRRLHFFLNEIGLDLRNCLLL